MVDSFQPGIQLKPSGRGSEETVLIGRDVELAQIEKRLRGQMGGIEGDEVDA